MPTIALTGVDLHVAVEGPPGRDVPAVVLLHGLGSSAADWAPQVAAFGERFRVLAIDLRGHGRSRPARGRLTVEGMADDVGAALTALGERDAHVVGLSLGGCVGLALALRHPARARSLTLVNTFARLAAAGARARVRMVQRLALLAVAPMPVVAAHVARGLFPKPEQRVAYDAAVASLAANPRRTYLATLGALARFDARAALAEVRCPALIVVGDRDDRVPRAAADALRQAIPRARLVVIPDSGHATPYDQPAAFNRAVLSFLGEVDDRNFPGGDAV